MSADQLIMNIDEYWALRPGNRKEAVVLIDAPPSSSSQHQEPPRLNYRPFSLPALDAEHRSYENYEAAYEALKNLWEHGDFAVIDDLVNAVPSLPDALQHPSESLILDAKIRRLKADKQALDRIAKKLVQEPRAQQLGTEEQQQLGVFPTVISQPRSKRGQYLDSRVEYWAAKREVWAKEKEELKKRETAFRKLMEGHDKELQEFQAKMQKSMTDSAETRLASEREMNGLSAFSQLGVDRR